ncbi:MAG: hypothetical protein V3W34_06850 [Phycisphaerae bacterium]
MVMQLFDWLTKRRKPLSQLTRSELRRKELMLEKESTRLLNRVKKLADEKQSIFEKGAQEKTPEVRRALAQQFELRTTEQLMVSRQLNVRGKEVLTVARLRMLRENSDRARETGGTLGLISEADILRLGELIENDAVRTEVYQERLDEVLGTAAAVDEGSAELSESGRTVMNIWDKMDSGVIADRAEAFDEADRRVREQQTAAEEPT